MSNKSDDPLDHLTGLYVEVRNNNVEHALRILKRKLKNSQHMLTIQNKQYYVKPSEKRRNTRHRGFARSLHQSDEE